MMLHNHISRCRILLLILASCVQVPSGFSFSITNGLSNAKRGLLNMATTYVEDGITITFEDEGNDDDVTKVAADDDNDDESPELQRRRSRWHQLHPHIKQRLIEEGQAKAIANKKKREPAQDKKRRMMLYVAKKQKEKKKASKIKRAVPFANRTALSAIEVGSNVTGTVISLTQFGVYVDIGTECDGLLHISQISRKTFIDHPRQVFSPGDTVHVVVKSTNPGMKKMHLTMLPLEESELNFKTKTALNNAAMDVDDDRIKLEELQVDDELWGEILRVTNYGAYVELGAIVQGFLHFMDHPTFQYNTERQHPNDFMNVGDRVRVWVSDLDYEKTRIKLTANRPNHLPGPRRELY